MGNKIIDKINKGEKAFGIGMSYYSDEIIELAGVMNLDFINYDGQHAPVTPETIDRFCRLCDGWGITPTMRVPDQVPSNILNYIDRGIKAITVPFVNTREQAEAVVKRYPVTKGIGRERGCGGAIYAWSNLLFWRRR